MTRIRKIVLVFLTLGIVATCLSGCTRQVVKDSSNYAKVWYNEECINIYSPISSTVALAITIESSGQTITFGEPVEIAEHQNKTICLYDLNVEPLDENAKITSADIIIQTYEDMTVVTCILVIFALAMMAFLIKLFIKIAKLFLSFWF